MASAAEVRRRKPTTETEDEIPVAASASSSEAEEIISDAAKKLVAAKPKKKSKKVEEDEYDRWDIALDIVRVVTFLFFASCGLSYLVSGGESFFWGMSDPPKVLKVDWWKAQFKGPIYLTPAELSLYDGTDPTKPIYLAINWTIYDVSANPRTYGPGGSYHYFAGCDAARAYVTGCFAEDRTPDMRGVEEMYLPLDDPEVDRHWSRAELKALKTKEREDALKKVHDGLKHWVDFFANSPKYNKVGYVKKPKDWPGMEPMRPLCESAAKNRKARKVPGKEDKPE
ncbi:membrane-associated progesterone-binding protein 4 [Podospora australis]|uniref:Membrane-associated progesterone-binding protein 4 n=1 Tax=Podospora australis TaxID=1536484 RepID=A0AAN7AF31_9PEZI|nr:membrane-associated progesterone-binding protein 4 [Podospora australis]